MKFVLYDHQGISLDQSLVGNPWLFASKRLDAHTDLFQFGRRDYDRNLGRWLTPDPQGYADGPNLYAYVHNRPLTLIDPWGLWSVRERFSTRDNVRSMGQGIRNCGRWCANVYRSWRSFRENRALQRAEARKRDEDRRAFAEAVISRDYEAINRQWNALGSDGQHEVIELSTCMIPFAAAENLMWKGMRAGYAAIKNVTLIKPLATKLEGVVARTIAHSKGLFNPIEQLTSTSIGKDSMDATVINEAFRIAKEGGRHAGFLNNNVSRSIEELRKGIAKLEKQISQHQSKIDNPSSYIKDWADLDPRQQQALIEKKWPSDIKRQTEQRDILKQIVDHTE